MPTISRKADTETKRRKARNSAKPKIGRPSAFNPKTAQALCALVAEGFSFDAACEKLGVNVSSAYRWMFAQPGFREDLYRARDLRGDWAFGEQIIAIADDASQDWKTAANGRQVVNKELVLRSKIRIEARQFHMSRLHRDTWGEKQLVDVKTDYSLMSEEERIRKAMELIGIVREIAGPKPEPPAFRYDPGTA